MRIKRNERIAGVPVLKIRDFFNRLKSADGNTFLRIAYVTFSTLAVERVLSS